MSDFVRKALSNQFLVQRSQSKDDLCIETSTKDLKSIFPSSRTVQKYARLLASISYYSLTTFLNKQTLGQEYFNLVLIDSSANTTPQLLKRSLLVLAKILNLILKSFLSNTNNILRKREFRRALYAIIAYIFARKVYSIVYLLDKNSYNTIEHHLLRIRYLHFGPTNKNTNQIEKMQFALALLKSMILFVYSHDFIQNVFASENSISNEKANEQQETLHLDKKQRETNSSTTATSNNRQNENQNKCFICLQAVTEATATNCGHIFCWNCLHNYFLQNNLSATHASCPNCRFLIQPNKCIKLINF